jgi:hypothetical protein
VVSHPPFEQAVTEHGPVALRVCRAAVGPQPAGRRPPDLTASTDTPPGLLRAIEGLDWPHLADELDTYGFAQSQQLLTTAECASLATLYNDERLFRSTIDMARHRFGSGQYRYFAYPLPETVATLRAAFYPHLVPIARAWATKLGRPAPWPDTLDDWLGRCHRAGQTRPTPLLLRYGTGDWNALHQDLYGESVFPLQVVIGLDAPHVDYCGGEFVMVEQRPRAQSRGHSATLDQGQAIIFTTRDRPVPSARGWSSIPMRHGVSTVRSGRRRALGLVFHDAT